MFKLVVLSALFVAVAVARPGLYESSPVLYSAPIVQEHSYAKIGSIVKSIPTAVSHQSSTVVHNHAHYVEPIIAPVLKTYAAPVLHTYAAPIVKTYAAPLVKTIAAPLYKSYASAPAHYTYAAAAPLAYASSW